MLARNKKRSNQRPDTLMHDRQPPDRKTSCDTRPDHTFGSWAVRLTMSTCFPICSRYQTFVRAPGNTTRPQAADQFGLKAMTRQPSLARTVASKNGFPLLAVGCSSARKSVPDMRTCAVIGPFLSPFLQLRSKRPLPGHRRHLLRKIMNKTIAATVNDPSTKMRGLSIGIFPVLVVDGVR
jgi:hypothetical protein